MARMTIRRGGDDSSVEITAPAWTNGALLVAAAAIAALTSVEVLAIGGTGGFAFGPLFGLCVLYLLRMVHERTVFTRESVLHRGMLVQWTVPMAQVDRVWFALGGGTVVLQYRDHRTTRFHIGERAIGTDLAQKRARIASSLVEVFGAPYAGITTADPPPRQGNPRLAPLSRAQRRFAPLLASEWAVVVGTVIVSALSLLTSRP